MASRVIRAWHYTRLTDEEVEIVRTIGLYPSSLATIRQRLDAHCASRIPTAETADALFEASPFHNDTFGGRTGKVWMVSHPRDVGDSGVILLLSNWGGESVYFGLQGGDLQRLVAAIGTPRVLEVAISMSSTRHAYQAAKNIVGSFARTLGCRPDRGGFDLYSTQTLGPECVLAIHSEGDATFGEIAKSYPSNYIAY
jgi:hypothetical protein